MATEYTITYRFTGQGNTSGERSVAFSKFTATGDTDKHIGQIKSITYIHYHTSDKPMTWNLRGRLMFSDGTHLVSSVTGNSISGNVVKFTNTFEEAPTAEQFARLASVQTLDNEDKTTAGGYYAKLYWRANDTYPMELVVTFIEQPPVTYAPKIDRFSVQRCDSNGSPNDEGERLNASLKLSIGDNAGLTGAQLRIYYAENAYPAVGESAYIDLNSRITELLGGVVNDLALLPGEWKVSSAWYFAVVFTTGEEAVIATASASRGSCCFHISDYPGGGAAIAGFSSGTTENPKFESYAPAYLYGGIAQIGDGSKPLLPILGIQFGTEDAVRVTSGGTYDVAVTFEHEYKEPPVVMATLHGEVSGSSVGNVSAVVRSVTTTGCTIRIASASTTYTIGLSWLACGQLA